jgi:hypothetical protein
MNDYAADYLLAQEALKSYYAAMLERKYDVASAFATDARIYCHRLMESAWLEREKSHV